MRTPLTHPLNVSYLVVGLVFLGISGSWALRAADVVDTAEIGWLLPLVLVAAGVIGLVALAARSISRARRRTTVDDSSYREDPEVLGHLEHTAPIGGTWPADDDDDEGDLR